jgi:hypothetical protein
MIPFERYLKMRFTSVAICVKKKSPSLQVKETYWYRYLRMRFTSVAICVYFSRCFLPRIVPAGKESSSSEKAVSNASLIRSMTVVIRNVTVSLAARRWLSTKTCTYI